MRGVPLIHSARQKNSLRIDSFASRISDAGLAAIPTWLDNRPRAEQKGLTAALGAPYTGGETQDRMPREVDPCGLAQATALSGSVQIMPRA